MKVLIKILLWVLIVAMVIFITFLVSSKVGGFASIREMIQYIISEVKNID